MTGQFDALKARWKKEREARFRHSEELLQRVRDEGAPLFARYGVRKALVYGSVAEGRATNKSDVDVLAQPLGPESYWSLLHDLEDLLECPVDLYTDTDEAAFVRRIERRGVVIYES